MKTSLLTTGPYMDMLFDGIIDDLTGYKLADGKIPLIALDDVGAYSLWIFDNPSESAGLNLEVATDQVSFAELAATFTKVTGKQGMHKAVPLEEYLVKAEPYPGAYSNWIVKLDVPRDESFMTWREIFAAWWRYWGEGKGATRNLAFLDRIHGSRIPSLEAWMRLKNYDGRPRSVLKDLHEHRKNGVTED
ncbi:unnamed protein product [Penicillium pancosmium]